MKDIKDLIPYIPSSIAICFGDPVTKSIGFTELISKGHSELVQKNNDWWEEYVTVFDVVQEIQKQFNSPEYIQFIRKTLHSLAYENRELKREKLLNIAKNYHLKHDDFKFDEKMLLLDILDSLSEIELIYLLSFYEVIDDEYIDYATFNKLELNSRLVSKGLLKQNSESLQKALNIIGEDINLTTKELSKRINFVQEQVSKGKTSFFNEDQPKVNFNPFFNNVEIIYEQTLLGIKFIDFINNGKVTKVSKNNSQIINIFF